MNEIVGFQEVKNRLAEEKISYLVTAVAAAIAGDHDSAMNLVANSIVGEGCSNCACKNFCDLKPQKSNVVVTCSFWMPNGKVKALLAGLMRERALARKTALEEGLVKTLCVEKV
jgi:hypothetical protein